MNPANPPFNATALLALDANGVVRSANDAAGRLWQTTPASLVGQPVVTFFAFEVTSNEPGWRESQWEVLIATALGRPLRLEAQPFEPVAAVEIRIELQAAHGTDLAYFAKIEVGSATAALATNTPSTATTVAATPVADGPATLATSGPLGFFDLDLFTDRLIISPAWRKMLGYGESELPGTRAELRALIHPEDTAALPDHAGKPPLGSTRDFSVEFRLRHRDGHYVWVQSSGVQLFDASRALHRVLGVNVDITERKEAEELGIASDDRLERLAESGSLAVFDLDFTTDEHWASGAFNELAGPDHSDSVPEALLALLVDSLSGQDLATFLSSENPAEASFTRAVTLRTADGERPALLGAHRQWSRKRELLRVVGFVLPLPAGTGPGAGAPSQLFQETLDALAEAVIVTDSRAQVVFLNAKAAALTGWDLDAARDYKLNDVFKLVRRENGRSDESAVDLVLAAEEKPRLYAEHALVSIAGGKAPAPITWTTRQILASEGGSAGIVVVFRDPNEMSLTPEEVVRANRFDSLGQLAGGIAHDFNNLLTTILGGISTAKDNRDYSKLEDAESACMAAKALTKQLLAFAKGSGALSQQVVAVGEILHDAVRIAAAGTTAVVSVLAPETVAPILVDRGQIIQVFQNLIINSLQAMPDVSKGRVQLRATNVRLAENDVQPLPAGDYVQIEVQDNGSGIPASHIEKIFEPFYTTKKTGTGLGLATVLSIVRKHGGQIGVDSTVGDGTTFTLFFPKADRPVEAAVRSAPALRFGTGRVLFLDDDPKICELTAGMLTSLDYTHDIVRTGEDAITFYRRYLNVGRPYDAVILDLNVVGGMGGEECFKQLRELHPEVRAIVNSGYDSEEIAQRYYDMGFVGYLTKPYRVGELGRVLKNALGK